MSALEGERCITCGDEGLPMRVSELAAPAGEARCVDGCGVMHSVALDLLDEVRVGEHVLVHAGVAIARTGGVLA